MPATRPVVAPWGRHDEDLLLIFTGGTTGMPKAVMWQQGDLMAKGGYGSNPLLGTGPMAAPEEAGPRAAASPIKPRSLIAPPLMHATGLIGAFTAIGAGGAVVLLPHGKFEPEEVWNAVERWRVTRMTIVGQPFAQPLLEALDANPGRWDLSSLFIIGSSGAMWNRENKLGLIRHIPQVQLMDSYSSSEAFGMGLSTTNAAGEKATATFELGPDCAIFTEDGRRVEPGSGESGRLAVGGPIPLGYYKDPVKSAQTFPTYEGKRWSMPGDWASVDADGTVRILGRGSQCINTGGEKVFPEEVEEALKRHPAVRDAAVTGVPDARYRRADRRAGRAASRRSARRDRIARPRQIAARDLQGAAPRAGGRQRRARAQRQARLQGDQGPRARRVRGAGGVTHPQQGLHRRRVRASDPARARQVDPAAPRRMRRRARSPMRG